MFVFEEGRGVVKCKSDIGENRLTRMFVEEENAPQVVVAVVVAVKGGRECLPHTKTSNKQLGWRPSLVGCAVRI